MFRKILVKYDETPEAKKALKIGLELARMAGSECHLVRVIKKPDSVPDIEAFHSEIGKELTFAGKDLDSARLMAGLAGLDLPTHTILGDSGEVLKNFARKGQFDLVVVTPKKESKLKDLFLGSYVENLLINTNISILVVR